MKVICGKTFHKSDIQVKHYQAGLETDKAEWVPGSCGETEQIFTDSVGCAAKVSQ